MHMVLEGELAAKLHAKDVKVGTSSDRIPIEEKVTNGEGSQSWIY